MQQIIQLVHAQIKRQYGSFHSKLLLFADHILFECFDGQKKFTILLEAVHVHMPWYCTFRSIGTHNADSAGSRRCDYNSTIVGLAIRFCQQNTLSKFKVKKIQELVYVCPHKVFNPILTLNCTFFFPNIYSNIYLLKNVYRTYIFQ